VLRLECGTKFLLDAEAGIEQLKGILKANKKKDQRTAVFNTVKSVFTLASMAAGPVTHGGSVYAGKVANWLVDKLSEKLDNTPRLTSVVNVLDWIMEWHKAHLESLTHDTTLTADVAARASADLIKKLFQIAKLTGSPKDETAKSIREDARKWFIMNILQFPSEAAMGQYSKLMASLNSVADDEAFDFINSFLSTVTSISDKVAPLLYSEDKASEDIQAYAEKLGLNKVKDWAQTTEFYKTLVELPLIGGTIEDQFVTSTQKQAADLKSAASGFASGMKKYEDFCATQTAGDADSDACGICKKCTTPTTPTQRT